VAGFRWRYAPKSRARNLFFRSYIGAELARDVLDLANVRQVNVLPRLLDRLAAQSAQLLNITKAARDAGLEPRTADNYVRLLEALFLVRRLPAWGSTLRARAARLPKLHLVDSGVAAHLLRITPAKLERNDPATLTEFGHLLETFVVGELLKQATWLDRPVDIGHWRTSDNQEVDLVIETHDGYVIGFEVKARQQVNPRDGAGLRALRGSLGDRFRAGIILSTGNASYTMDDRIQVAPIDRLWRPTPPATLPRSTRRTPET
jgi:predicted AAA+ superfamily ATPase